MPQPLNPLPNDGPVMRWAIEHGQQYLMNQRDKQNFHNDISAFRHARDFRKSRARIDLCIHLEGFAGTIEMISGPDAYGFSIQLGSSAWISECLTKGRHSNDQRPRSLTVSARGCAPMTVLSSLIGEPAERLIQLPGSLQTIIAGRTVLTARLSGNDINANLSTDPI
jgi:hypothetical protein